MIQEHNLEQHDWFAKKEQKGLFAGVWTQVRSWLGRNSTKTPSEEQSTVDPQVMKTYLNQLQVKPFPRTRLVKVLFTSPDPVLSARLVNAHATAYMHYGVELRTRANIEAQQFLEEKLVELKERVEKSEAALNDYRRDKGILSLDEKENIVVDRLSDLN